MNLEVIADRVNGRLARTSAEWVTAIRELAADPALRERLGRAGKRTVEERYSTRAQAPRVAAVLRRADSRSTR